MSKGEFKFRWFGIQEMSVPKMQRSWLY